MLGACGLRTKKDVKALIGKRLDGHYIETSMFKEEYTDNGRVTMVGPDAYSKRSWYATITITNGIVTKVQ